MSDEFLTLAELAERAGVEIRTLRSWMAQGVIPGPEAVGRNARYAADALTRARAVRAMRELFGMSLTQIRQELLTAGEERIASYAASVGGDVEAPSKAPEGSAPSGTSAAQYLRSLRQAGVFGSTDSSRERFVRPPPAARSSLPFSAQAVRPSTTAEERLSGSRLAQLVEALERLTGAPTSRRKARGEVRFHIPITPDLELVVRGEHAPEEIARFEQIADRLRILLTGGPDHD